MLRVLVVDDDRAIRELLRFALECEGYEVSVFRDGVEILDYLAAGKAGEAGVILMDIMMPRLDGWEVCRRLDAEPDLLGSRSLVLMTASLIPVTSLPSPACAILPKPFNLEQLYSLVSLLELPVVASSRNSLSLSEHTLLAS
jgi:two-component system response regulator MprA